MKPFSLLLSLLLFAACDFATSDNGQIDGNWQMVRVDTVGGGHADVKDQQIFYAFQFHLLDVRSERLKRYYVFRFTHEGDSLKLGPAHDWTDRANPVVDSLPLLRPYGINQADEHFRIAGLDKDKLVLQSHTVALTFRRY